MQRVAFIKRCFIVLFRLNQLLEKDFLYLFKASSLKTVQIYISSLRSIVYFLKEMNVSLLLFVFNKVVIFFFT